MINPKTILITGTSSGIGYATATELKKRGHRVIAAARQPKDVDRLRREGFESLQIDLNDSQSIRLAVSHLIKITDGKIDALFNNAATGQPGAVEDLSRVALREQFETNLFGPHELTCLIIPLMRKQGCGRIIFNSSVLGLVAMTQRGAYNASKFALEGLVDTLRLELHGTGIDISLIEPGPIATDFRKNSLPLYKKHIDPANSPRQKEYEKVEARLTKEEAYAFFTLPPEAVAKKVIHAIESNRPKIRYYVTFPTYLFGFLKHVLPTQWLDCLLRQI